MKVIHFVRRLHSDSLARNSLYLMISTLIMAVLGFFFWIMVARLYKPEEIGIATSLISVVGLISTLSQLGFNNSLIRDLPSSEGKNKIVNTVCTLVAVTAAIFAVFYLIGIDFFSPKLHFLRENHIVIFLFLGASVVNAVNSITDNIFIGLRNSKYILIYNSVFSVTKLILPFFLTAYGAFGIFLSVMGGIAAALTLTIFFLITVYNLTLRPMIDRAVLNKTLKYSATTYLTGLIGSIPSMLLPVLVLNILGPAHAAYYYMAFTIANLLFVIPQSVTRSLFAESAYDTTMVKRQVLKAAKIMYALIVPSVIIALVASGLILRVFGKSYSAEGLTLLRILAVSTVFMIINYIGGTLFHIGGRLRLILIYNTAGAVLMLVATVAGMHYTHSLNGLGAGFLFAQAVMTVAYIPQILRALR